jgi:hypothetical protein
MEEEIRARFAKSKISTNDFKVRVQNGVATLTGKTEVIQHKGTATRIARSCGARVVNNIQVGDRARANAAERLSSTRRSTAAASPKPPEKAADSPPAPGPGDVPPPVRRATVKH